MAVEPLGNHPEAVPVAAEWYTERGSGAQALYERPGWQAMHAGRYEDIDVTVMRAFSTGVVTAR